MYCHDARHTGRSPYSTASNLGIEKWRFDTINECSGSPIIDKQGEIKNSIDFLTEGKEKRRKRKKLRKY